MTCILCESRGPRDFIKFDMEVVNDTVVVEPVTMEMTMERRPEEDGTDEPLCYNEATFRLLSTKEKTVLIQRIEDANREKRMQLAIMVYFSHMLMPAYDATSIRIAV